LLTFTLFIKKQTKHNYFTFIKSDDRCLGFGVGFKQNSSVEFHDKKFVYKTATKQWLSGKKNQHNKEM
jgi:hypothetical protein